MKHASTLRRLVFTTVILSVVLGLLDLRGRWQPDPRVSGYDNPSRDRLFLYDPQAPQVVEVAPGQWTFARGGISFRTQTWYTPAPANTYRVIVVGDSTVYGLFPKGLAQGLEVPGQRVEVLNFGSPGAASDRARIMVQAALGQDPDLVLVYVGHNDVKEARLNPISQRPFWQRTLSSEIRYSGLARLLERALGDRAVPAPADIPKKAAQQTWGRLESAEWNRVGRNYRRNLLAMAEAAAEQNCPLGIIAPISSLIFPPQEDPSDPVGAGLRQALFNATRALDGDEQALQEALARMSRDFAGSAPLAYLDGRVRLRAGDKEGALDQLRTARRLDNLPSRSCELHTTLLITLQHEEDLPLIETEPAFLADPRYLDPTDPLFMDDVHPTIPGILLLCEALLSGGAKLFPAGARFRPEHVRLLEPTDDTQRGWRIPPDDRSPQGP